MEHDEQSPEQQPNSPSRTPRNDGWTADRQEAFLRAYAACGTVSAASRAVGMSRQSVYDLYARPSAIAFRKAFDAARDCTMGLVEDGAAERSIYGVPRPIFYKGEKIGEWRHYDERLTMFLLRYRRQHRYGSQLDRLPPPPPPVHPPGWDLDEPDEDEAMGRLECHLDDLTDFGDPRCFGPESPPRESIVNFVNFDGKAHDDD